MCKDKMILCCNLEPSNNVSLVLNDISKEECEEVLNRPKNLDLLYKIGKCYDDNIRFNIIVSGYSGFDEGYSEEDEKFNEYFYGMDCFKLRIPLELLENNELKNKLINYYSNFAKNYSNVDFEINDNSELQIEVYESNHIGVRNFTDILTIINFTKEENEEILQDNGVLKAHCYLEFTAWAMW